MTWTCMGEKNDDTLYQNFLQGDTASYDELMIRYGDRLTFFFWPAAVIHPFAEHISYYLVFSIPLITTTSTRTASGVSIFGYITYIDFMNNLGHCNFELIPKWTFSLFPPLKYLMYTPS